MVALTVTVSTTCTAQSYGGDRMEDGKGRGGKGAWMEGRGKGSKGWERGGKGWEGIKVEGR